MNQDIKIHPVFKMVVEMNYNLKMLKNNLQDVFKCSQNFKDFKYSFSVSNHDNWEEI